MTLYNNFLITAFIIFYLNTILSIRNPHLVVQNAGLDTVFPTATGLVFVVSVNNTSDDDFEVELTGDKCCLAVGEEINCNLLEVIGTCAERIPRGTTKTMKLVAPILDPLERVGHCIFYLDSKSASRRKKTMRNRVKVDFDTRLQNKHQSMVIPRNVRKCNEIEEDPLNDCKLVDCDSYYNGKKSYFDRKTRKCTEIPECLSNSEVLAVYDPKSNKCMEDVLKKEDVEFVKKLIESKHRNPKDILLIKTVNPHSQSAYNVFETNGHKMVKTTLKPESDKVLLQKKKGKYIKLMKLNTKEEEKSMMNDKSFQRESTISDNKDNPMDIKLEPEPTLAFRCINYMFKNCTVNVLGVIIIIQCCCIFTIICFLPKSCTCPKKKLVSNFFNYRQDASVTTPLIDTSNIDTETTNYTSESNIDKKIKCYKACQRNEEMKLSLSDDILSKCVTRRDWHSKPEKYTPQTYKNNTDIFKIQENNEKKELEHETIVEEKVEEQVLDSSSFKLKDSENKVFFREQLTESREREKKSALYKSIIQKLEAKSDSEEKVPKCDSSEKEIQSHLYTDEKPKDNKEECIKNCEIYNAEDINRKTFSISTEKATQAEFSNDTIDDFLSEGGLEYLAGDLKQSSLSFGSSNTSKNNIIKNVWSIFRRASKTASVSEPGTKKSGHNMELIHMSHASLHSSSNNGSEYFKCFKRGKESRSSL